MNSTDLTLIALAVAFGVLILTLYLLEGRH